jgi:hypothetical protein
LPFHRLPKNDLNPLGVFGVEGQTTGDLKTGDAGAAGEYSLYEEESSCWFCPIEDGVPDI